MSITKDICVVCAWRVNCQKKFSISGRDIRCPDFSRDISIKHEEKKEGIKEKKQGKIT